MDMLGLMHEAEPYGELRLNGKALKPAGLAALLGDRVSDVSRWLLELEVAGVFSRRNDGTIFSRRMERDRAKSLKAKEVGEKGGNPALKRKDNLEDKAEDKAQRLEARDQKPEELELSADADLTAVWFDRFWKSYPIDRNMSRKAAETQWKRLSPDKRAAAIAAVPGFKAYCAANASWYRPVHAERFLSQERFEGYAAAPVVGQPDEAAARAAWGGQAGKLIDALGDNGHPQFVAWFYDAAFEPGPQPRLTVRKEFVKKRIVEIYMPALRKAFGGDVVLEVAA
jgi:hypothetical protein